MRCNIPKPRVPTWWPAPVDADYLKQVQLDSQFETWRAELAGNNI